jgi:multiple sugar transport system permease protein
MNFFRVLYYLPVLIPAVCGGLVWKNITNEYYGIANKFLLSLGFEKYTWFSQYSTAMPSFIFIGLFGLGGSMILWLAQLKNVPISLYEGAKIEGASYFTQLFKITVPMCTPMIFYNLVLSVITTLQTFTTVQVLTDGAGPDYSLLFYLMNVYSAAFTNHNLGYAAALSFILMIIIGIFTFIIFKTSKWVYYGEEN